MNEKDILRKMVSELQKILTPDLRQEMQARGRTLHETLTLASIVEKEARVAEERELISAVYNNRLRINMKLDSDPTVIYGLQNFNGNLTRADLKKDTPYNTYTRRGLPPGPIANPGKASILAALRPADVKYLYFVCPVTTERTSFQQTIKNTCGRCGSIRKNETDRRETDLVHARSQTPFGRGAAAMQTLVCTPKVRALKNFCPRIKVLTNSI